MIKIIADENLAYPNELFSQFGEVRLVNGRNISNSMLKDIDVLIVRSVTDVNESLLTRTNVKFVGTATIGTDHIDIDYLNKNGIAFASAAGCNSYAVTEYLVAALLFTAVKENFSVKDKIIGVVGIGNVGSKVVRFCEALGMKVLKNDPPLYSTGKLNDALPLNDLFEADIISLHVPLTFEGENKTFHLFDEDKLNRLKDNAILINTSRGSVVNNKSLKEIIEKKNLKVIWDVWENEPNIDEQLVDQILIGTPHIAGYTFEGKVNGTIMICEALVEFLKNGKFISLKLPGVNDHEKEFNTSISTEFSLNKIVKSIYDIEKDHNEFLLINSLKSNERGKYFDKLRKVYPVRREFNNYSVRLSQSDSKTGQMLKNLRFKISGE